MVATRSAGERGRIRAAESEIAPSRPADGQIIGALLEGRGFSPPFNGPIMAAARRGVIRWQIGRLAGQGILTVRGFVS